MEAKPRIPKVSVNAYRHWPGLPFVVDWREYGQRFRKFFHDEAAAKAFAKSIRANLRRRGVCVYVRREVIDRFLAETRNQSWKRKKAA